MPGSPVSRRAVLSYSLGIAGATYAGVVAKEDLQRKRLARRHAGPPAASPPPGPRPGPGAFPEPGVRRSRDGELDVTLTARSAAVNLGAAALVHTYTYNGRVPGDTWEIRPGDTLRVRLRNRLPAGPHGAAGPDDRPHAWTTTNLHTHGLHVSPAGHADNVFARLPPGADRHIKISVPGDHPGGLFWYHPHWPGAITQQLRAGMAGALIVRGALDAVAEVAAARERLMVLQAIETGADWRLPSPVADPGRGQAFFPKARTLYRVNGVLAPALAMYPGEIQRWRLVNATAATFMSLRLTGHEFRVLAWDGLTLAAPDPARVLLLAPGSRADVLVRAGGPGRYHLMLTPGTALHPGIPGMPGGGTRPRHRRAALRGFPAEPGELSRRALLTVHVAGSGPAMRLPSALPAYDPPGRPVARHRRLSFSTARRPGGHLPRYGVDGVPYDPARRPEQVILGSTEEWTVVNEPGRGLPPQARVLHLHTNPFLVTKRNGTALIRPQWRDTCVLTAGAGDSVTVRTSFLDFGGRTAVHSQLAPQDDLGLLAAIDVMPDGGPR